MKRNLVETLVGAVVLVVAAAFLVLAYAQANLRTSTGYTLVAKFDRIDGLKSGGEVRISGIKVGTVIAMDLDPKSFLAIVKMDIASHVKLPKDTSAAVSADGLLGEKFIALNPGGADDNLKPNGEIALTQGTVDVVGLIGQYIFSQTGSGDDKKKTDEK
ncbi:MAG: outer membrane lipid asymmetry maintenance protein MlaD [Alphaproteobacteria bacterium]|nr:outer membrane lipid asymmetry maintenance protein MlaD [Alphaproteobacteria bacterium]